MEELSLDNILTEDQINDLFLEEIQEQEPPKDDKDKGGEAPEDTEKPEIETTEASPEALFGGEPESVGSEEETKDKKGTSSKRGDTSSNFYSSIANALVEDGVLQNLDEDRISKINSAEDFTEVINDYINSQLDERQKRVSEALKLGVEPTEVQKYERCMEVLDGISEDKLTDETEAGENLRKNLIYQDCLNKGFSEEKAKKMVERSFKAGTDIDDARDALQDNKSYFKKQYDSMLDQAREAEKKEQEKLKKQSEELRTSILEEDKAFGEIKLDKPTRQRVLDSIMKPVYTDPNTGDKLTAIQKYEFEHRTDFLKNVGLLFVLTDGFKNIDRLVSDKLKKERKSSIRELEHKLKTPGSGISSGELSFANNSGDTDPESLFKGWKLSV